MSIERKCFVLAVQGSIYSDRGLESFLTILSDFVKQGLLTSGEFELHFVDGMPDRRLTENLAIVDFVRSEGGGVAPKEAIDKLSRATAILYIERTESGGTVPEKFYNCLTVGKRILALVPNSGAFEPLIDSEPNLYVADIRDYSAISAAFLRMYSDWKMSQTSTSGRVVAVPVPPSAERINAG